MQSQFVSVKLNPIYLIWPSGQMNNGKSINFPEERGGKYGLISADFPMTKIRYWDLNRYQNIS